MIWIPIYLAMFSSAGSKGSSISSSDMLKSTSLPSSLISALKSSYTRSWSSQYLSSLFLKVLSVFDVTIFSCKLFQYFLSCVLALHTSTMPVQYGHHLKPNTESKSKGFREGRPNKFQDLEI
jgi:hypothetical protein